MSLRKFPFLEGHYYHIYNRGVDKRDVILDSYDLGRFFKSMGEFNTVKPIGSIYENRERKRGSEASTKSKRAGPLVKFIVFGINQNHYHFVLEQVVEKGIEKFMHRIGTGFTKYFNTKYGRSGSLFQGVFKAKLIDSIPYLLHLSAYVNLNNLAHSRGSEASTLSKTSWDEYINENCSDSFCEKGVILEQFKNLEEYRIFAENSLKGIIERKISLQDLEKGNVEILNLQ